MTALLVRSTLEWRRAIDVRAKTAVITGARHRLGRAIAPILADRERSWFG